jgi:hypothetical protein
MSEDRENLSKAYKRAAIGLAIAAVLWLASLLIVGAAEENRMIWFVPIGAAALSVLCFSLYTKSKS